MNQLRSAGPTPPERSAWALARGQWLPSAVRGVKLELSSTPAAPAEARHRALAELGELLAPAEQLNLELLISELVTNCVRHSGMSGSQGEITVLAAVAPERLRIEVCDCGAGFAPQHPVVPNLEHGPGGLGLVLLDRLATIWGVAREDAFCVWAEFERQERH